MLAVFLIFHFLSYVVVCYNMCHLMILGVFMLALLPLLCIIFMVFLSLTCSSPPMSTTPSLSRRQAPPFYACAWHFHKDHVRQTCFCVWVAHLTIAFYGFLLLQSRRRGRPTHTTSQALYQANRRCIGMKAERQIKKKKKKKKKKDEGRKKKRKKRGGGGGLKKNKK